MPSSFRQIGGGAGTLGERRPKYQQVCDQLYEEMGAGRLTPGQALPTEAKLSKILGVSRTTLRQALGKLEDDGVIERVQGRGTFLNSQQQRESRKRLDAFAFIAPQIREGGYPSLIYGFEQACSEIEHQAIIGNSSNDVGRQADLILRLINQAIGGVCLVPTTAKATPAHQIEILQKNHVPVVCCHRTVNGVSTPAVVFRGDEIGRKAGEVLLERGHRRIGILSPHRYSMIDEREVGMREVIAAHSDSASCKLTTVEYGTLLTPPAPEAQIALNSALTGLLSQRDRPTAIFCHCLQDAEQVYLRAEDMGLKIPRDLSLLYFGSTWRENTLANRISCVAADEDAIGARAAELLHEMRAGKRAIDDNEQIVFPISLFEGETLGPNQSA